MPQKNIRAKYVKQTYTKAGQRAAEVGVPKIRVGNQKKKHFVRKPVFKG